MSSSGVPTNIENGKLTTDLDAAGNDLLNLDPKNQVFGFSYRNLSEATGWELDKRINDLTAGSTSQNLFTTLNNSGSGTYIRNPDWFGSDLDFTCVSVFCNETTGIGSLKTIVLIAPNIGLSANHVGITNGKTYRFVDATGISTDLVVSSSSNITDTDIQVVFFTTSAPATIVPAVVMQEAQAITLIAPSGGFFIDQSQKAFAGDLVTAAAVNESGTSNRSQFWKSGGIVTGDSSHPIFTILDGKAIFLATFYVPNGGSGISYSFDSINSRMTLFGGSYQLQTITAFGAGTVAGLSASLTPESGQVPIVQSSGQLDPAIVPAPGLNLTLALTLQTVSDANIASTDWTNYSTMVLTAITAPRVWTLPIAASDASLTNGSIKLIVDRSFQISNTNILTLTKGSVGSTIDGADTLVLNNPGSVVALQWNALGGKWKILWQFSMPPQFTRLGVGTSPDSTIPISVSLNSTSPTVGPLGTITQQTGADGINTISLTDTFGGFTSYMGRRAQGTAVSKSGVVAGNVLVQLAGRGYDSSSAYSVSTQGAFQVAAAETWTSTAHGSYLNLVITALGSITPMVGGRVQPSGGLSIGATAISTDPGAGNLLLDGNLRQGVSTGVPAAAGATGVAGTFAFDTGFVYVCTATNTWKRVAIATW